MRPYLNVNPWLIHVNVWQKPLQYCKVISLQLIKIIGKKNKVMQYPDLKNFQKINVSFKINIYMILCTYIISFIPWPE